MKILICKKFQELYFWKFSLTVPAQTKESFIFPFCEQRNYKTRIKTGKGEWLAVDVPAAVA